MGRVALEQAVTACWEIGRIVVEFYSDNSQSLSNGKVVTATFKDGRRLEEVLCKYDSHAHRKFFIHYGHHIR